MLEAKLHDISVCIAGLFFAILFLQSGFDKVLNWKTELAFNREHFSKTFLRNIVPFLLGILTVMEISSGFLSAVGVIVIWNGNHAFSSYASLLCLGTLLCLFFGQRIAKDYGGAAVLTGYFVVALIDFILINL